MCGNYSREETIQGRKLYEEIRYIKTKEEVVHIFYKNRDRKEITFFDILQIGCSLCHIFHTGLSFVFDRECMAPKLRENTFRLIHIALGGIQQLRGPILTQF